MAKKKPAEPEKKEKKIGAPYKLDERGVEGEIYEMNDHRNWDHGDNLFLLECWVRDGLTQAAIAEKIGIDPTTLSRWTKRVEPIKKVMFQSKELVDYRVENALLKAALGYETVEEEVIIGKADPEGNREVRRRTVTKEVGPNVVACMAWLNNKKPNEWKRNRDNTLELDDDDKNISIKIYKATGPDDKTVIVDTDDKSKEDE